MPPVLQGKLVTLLPAEEGHIPDGTWHDGLLMDLLADELVTDEGDGAR